MHPACASLITRCVLDRTPVPVPVSQQVPLKTKRGANFHFHFYTSILSRCSHPDRPGTSYIQYLVNAVSHSLSRSCRAVPCVVFVTLTWTLEPDLLDSKEPAIPPPSLFLHHHLAVDLVLNPPPSFYSAGKPASQIYSSHLGLPLLRTVRLNLPGLPAPSPSFGTWKPVCT